ncbi:hypothetical protein D3C86_1366610 [compost metagenome]
MRCRLWASTLTSALSTSSNAVITVRPYSFSTTPILASVVFTRARTLGSSIGRLMLGMKPKVKDLSRSDSAKLAVPPRAVRLMLGSWASRAWPTMLYADSTRYSAATMSGRRASNCDGSPAGTTGSLTRSCSRPAGTLKSPAGTPTSVPSAFSATSRERRSSIRSLLRRLISACCCITRICGSSPLANIAL